MSAYISVSVGVIVRVSSVDEHEQFMREITLTLTLTLTVCV